MTVEKRDPHCAGSLDCDLDHSVLRHSLVDLVDVGVCAYMSRDGQFAWSGCKRHPCVHDAQYCNNRTFFDLRRGHMRRSVEMLTFFSLLRPERQLDERRCEPERDHSRIECQDASGLFGRYLTHNGS